MNCCGYCTAYSYQIKSLYDSFRARYKSTYYREVVHVEIPHENHRYDAFYFEFGATVIWGPNLEEGFKLLEEIKDFEKEPLENIETDHFTYSHGESAGIQEDVIILPNEEVLTKLAVSFGIAQSVKLGAFEFTITHVYELTKHIPLGLAKTGRIPLSQHQIRKKMGELFIERSMINLHIEVLDTPEFFWDNPDLEKLYMLSAAELEVDKRVEVLNHRLDVLHELFDMLANELHNKHSNRLEWIIIILIVIEVCLTLLHDVFKLI